MSKLPERIQTPLIKPWLVPLAVVGVIAAAVISYARSGETYAAAGSPYYDKAVKEAINGLVNPGAVAAPAGRPALPAGLSPAEHYWCENCKAYHKIPPGGVAPPADSAPASGTTPAAHQVAEIPPLLAGVSPNDYEWCDNCKAFHKLAGQGHSAAGTHPPAGAASAGQATPAGQAAAGIPPLPPEYSPNDYEWCATCKAYHKRQPVAPAVPPPAP